MAKDPSLENLKCPKCKGPMKSRINRVTEQRFWGCADFPRCNGTRDTDGLSLEDKYGKSGEYHGNKNPEYQR